MLTSKKASLSTKNILVVCGGGGSEHAISLISAKYILNSLLESPNLFNPKLVILDSNGNFVDDSGREIHLDLKNYLKEFPDWQIHFAIPCIHGPPGETGEIQSLFKFHQIPFLGADHESSAICFNKLSCKLWLQALSIPNTAFTFVSKGNPDALNNALEFQRKYKRCFVKAASQGSSVGCYRADNEAQLKLAIEQAFQFSNEILIEQAIFGRELEISVYEKEGKVLTSHPGEIIAPDGFYSYEEKYSEKSQTQTLIKAQNLSESTVREAQRLAQKAFKGLNLRDLARVDFFLDGDQLLINEINTFPGMTPISMFPKMMEANGDHFPSWLGQTILNRFKT